MITAAASVIIIVAIAALLWALQRRLMYFPTSDVPTPAELGLSGVEPVVFDTEDGLRLAGWLFAAPESPSPVTVLVFNGNAGNRAHRSPLAAALRRHGFQVLLFDYRGYGGNPGAPSEDGLAADARAARAYLVERPDVDAGRLVYFGESLGTALAVELAADRPPAALILRSPFTSMVDVASHHYPALPVDRLLRDRYMAVDRIARVPAPLLVIAGGRDQIVPVEYSRRLYDAAPGAKTLLVLPDADHNDYELLAGDEMIRAIVAFLHPLR
jgi:fermentation-respiration switch protein FrsA (DUF1100 family)